MGFIPERLTRPTYCLLACYCPSLQLTLTQQGLYIPFVDHSSLVEKAPLPAHEVERVHEVGPAQVLGRDGCHLTMPGQGQQ